MKKWRFASALLVVAALVLPFAATGCSGASVTTPYEFSDFTRLDIQNAFNVELVQSGTYSITITSSKALLDFLFVEKQGDTVTIKLHPNHPFTDFVLMRKVLRAKITMPALKGLAVSGACKATVSGFESSGSLDLDVSGASTVSLNGIEVGPAKFAVSGASRLDGKLTCADVSFDVSGASKVKLQGTANDVQLVGSGASEVDLEQFVNQTATVTLSGSTKTTIDARKHLDFSLNGASELFFLSNPVVGKMEVLGASTAKHKT